MAHRIELEFHRSLESLVPRGSRVLAAVSGGGDSVALLHLLLRSSRRLALDVVVGHLDHGLRRGSAADLRFVRGLARDLDVPCLAERRGVVARRDESPEEAARRVRRAFLLETAKQCGAARIATGHTLDDQAETVLMRLVRGAGATALTGMASSGPGPFVRPLLTLERDELRRYLARRRIPFREDPSNRNLRFDRNRVRRLVLPTLTDALNPRAARHLVRAAERFRDDALYLDEVATGICEEVCTVARGRVVVDTVRLRSQPTVLARRVVRRALLLAGADGRRIGTRHIEALLRLASSGTGAETHLPGHLVARSRRGRITIAARD